MKIRLTTTSLLIAAAGLAGCASTSPGYTGGSYGSHGGYGSSVRCDSCGVVTRIDQRSRGSGAPNATGAVLGGIVGAVAAREIAERNTDSEGRANTATVAGAVGGAVAGNAIQNRVQSQTVYDVHVRLDDGRMTVVTQNDLGGIREGSHVDVGSGQARLR